MILSISLFLFMITIYLVLLGSIFYFAIHGSVTAPSIIFSLVMMLAAKSLSQAILYFGISFFVFYMLFRFRKTRVSALAFCSLVASYVSTFVLLRIIGFKGDGLSIILSIILYIISLFANLTADEPEEDPSAAYPMIQRIVASFLYGLTFIVFFYILAGMHPSTIQNILACIMMVIVSVAAFFIDLILEKKDMSKAKSIMMKVRGFADEFLDDFLRRDKN